MTTDFLYRALSVDDLDISTPFYRDGLGFQPIDETNEAYKLGVNYIIYGLTH